MVRWKISPAFADPVKQIYTGVSGASIALNGNYANLGSGDINLTADTVSDGTPKFVSVGTLHNTTDVDQVLKQIVKK